MKTYNIKQTRTYVTRVTIEAESIDEAYDKHAELVNNGTMGELELEQMEIADDDVEITDPTKKYRFARVCSVTGCGMMKKKVGEETQEALFHEMVSASGINVVTCGNCGHVVLHRSEDTELSCPDCKFTSEPCDFPDLYS